MSGTGGKRKLAAILCADVAEYSRLMQLDDAGTVARLHAHRRVVRETAERHGGRVVNAPGDSILAEFASAVAAVRCAIEIQACLERTQDTVPPESRMYLRIGVNLGEVIEEGDGSIYGDGVNIAARLEALAERAGVCISGKVFEEVEGKVQIAFDFLGEREVKNIARPVPVYRARLRSAPPTGRTATPLALPEKPSIVVLPFENMSGDPEQGYFADGITEDLMTALAKLSGIFVIARNSAFSYKGRAVKVQDVSRELGVRHVLEGSVRKAGKRLRITAQLIDGLTGGHVWAERYDRDTDDIFAVQDEVTEEIVSVLAVKLTSREKGRLGHRSTGNLEAYEAFLRGREQFWRHTKQGMALARPQLEAAVARDPDFALAWATLALAHNMDYINRWTTTPHHSQEQALALAARALQLDAEEPWVHFAVSTTCLWAKRVDEALDAARRALELEPNFAPAHAALGNALVYAGQARESLAHVARAMRLDPFYPSIYLYIYGLAQYLIGEYRDATETLRRRLARDSDADTSRVLLAACHGQLGETEIAQREWVTALAASPQYSLRDRREVWPFKNAADFEHIVEGLRLAGIAQAMAP